MENKSLAEILPTEAPPVKVRQIRAERVRPEFLEKYQQQTNKPLSLGKESQTPSLLGARVVQGRSRNKPGSQLGGTVKQEGFFRK